MGDATLTEEPAAPEQVIQETAKPKRIRLPRLKWPRRRADEPETPPTEESEPAPPSPLAYKTFSPNIAPSLTALGGVLAVLGGLGTWVRATEFQGETAIPEQVAATMGYTDPEGLTIAVFGGLAVLSAIAWAHRRPLFNRIPPLFLKVIPVIASAAVVGLAAWQLPLIDLEAQQLAVDARARADFVAYHAGFGWGAWCLLAAAVSLAIGTFIGVLREFDVRKGYGG